MEEIIVVRNIWIDAPQARAWEAVTDPVQLTKWYAPGSPWDIPELKQGKYALFHHSPNEYHSGTEVVTMRALIVEVDAPHKLALRWEYDSPEDVMVTSFILREENGGTLVTITETGYETKEQAAPTEEGYAMSLENLKAHLEGREIPH